MIDATIITLKEELGQLINEGADNEKIYELSVRLDKLIVQYYIEHMANENVN